MITSYYADSTGVYEPRNAVTKPYDVSSWFTELGHRPAEDEKVTSLNAIQHGLVWSAVNLIAGDVGQIPMNVMRVNGEMTEVDERHPVHRALNVQPNLYQTPAVWAEFMVAQMLVWGNSFSQIRWDGLKRKVELHPIPSQYVTYYTDDAGLPFYWVTLPGSDPLPLELNEVLHFRGLTNNGFWGHRLVEVAYPELQFTRSVVRHASNTFDNSAVPSGILEHPGKLPPETRSQLREDWEKIHKGSGRAGRIGVLWEGMKFNPVAISNIDAQMLESLQQDAVVVSRLFQLPPYKLGDYRFSSTRANLEDAQREYFNQTLSRRLVMITQEITIKLFAMTLGRYKLKPDPTELLKGDKATQVTTARNAVEGTLWTRNEGRKYLGMNPVEGGDEFANPNTTPGPEQAADDPVTVMPDDMQDRLRALVLAQSRVVCVMERNKVQAKQKAKHRDAVVRQYYRHDFVSYAIDKLTPAYDVIASPQNEPLKDIVEGYAKLALLRALEVDADKWDVDQTARELATFIMGENGG